MDFNFCCQNYDLSSFCSIHFLSSSDLSIVEVPFHDSTILSRFIKSLHLQEAYLQDANSFFHLKSNFLIDLKVNLPKDVTEAKLHSNQLR